MVQTRGELEYRGLVGENPRAGRDHAGGCWLDGTPAARSAHEGDAWAKTMGRYCVLYFDDVWVCGARSGVPEDWRAAFQESDRLADPWGLGEQSSPPMVYETSRETFIDRLNLLGCSEALARERVTEQIERTRLEWEERAEDGEEVVVSEELAALRTLTTPEWYSRVPRILEPVDRRAVPRDVVDRRMDDEDWVWFDDFGELIRLRALLDASPNVKRVRLDATELTEGGWVDPEGPICDRDGDDWGLATPLAPVMVLAEGKWDIRVLAKSLSVLFPDREEFFTFFQHSAFRVDGGASFLVKMLRAFAAARAPLRLVAVFDNDTAGLEALRQARSDGLPARFALVRLPDIALARGYPTLGPTGEHVADVNGRAASIELYLGREALSEGEELRPVRWKGVVKGEDTYQGEVEGKARIQEKFERLLGETCVGDDACAAFPELVAVWEVIFRAVAPGAEAAQRRSLQQLDAANVQV